ncbi:MAG TPA: hypothetical protein VHG08_10375 [Longimicrobium sp.]|nr:hypothetical protein [Longimicrobium sp.]
MIRVRIRRPFRAAAAALLLALPACDEGITTPRVLAGHWLAVETYGTQNYRIEDRLELRQDGGFTWTTANFAPEGRAEDGLVSWFSRVGSWGVDGDWFALGTASGMMWEHGRGWSQVDYAGEWRRGHRLRMEGDRMILEEKLPPEYSRAPRTMTFIRTANFDDAPRPPAGP